MTGSTGGELFAYLLRLGDDALVTAQRLGEWSARAPEMEQDIALSNIALDQLGAARLFLTYAGEVEAAGRDEDALAYLRQDFEFCNAQLVELSDTDFGTAIAKLLCLAAFQHPLYEALSSSVDERIAGIAAKAVKESAYHLDHATLWTVRLGDGTAESHRRMADALDEVWPYTFELFESDPVDLMGIANVVLAKNVRMLRERPRFKRRSIPPRWPSTRIRLRCDSLGRTSGSTARNQQHHQQHRRTAGCRC